MASAGRPWQARFRNGWRVSTFLIRPRRSCGRPRINPLLVFIAVLVGASLGSLIGGIFGGFVAALMAIPTAGPLQVLVKGVWQATAPDDPRNPRRPRLSQ